LGELLPNHVIGVVSGITICFNWTLVFLVTRFFEDLKAGMGIEWCYWMFSIFSAIGTVFVFFFVPETKCKSLEDIQKQFASK
jgi:SP family facilitated glucose transporter-like MFS transporter 8